jgi:hypothetical protein
MNENARAPHQKLVLASAALCVLASAFLLFWPAGVVSESGSGTVTSDGDPGDDTRTTETRPLVGEIGTADVVFFAVPVAIAGFPLLVRRRRPAIVARGISAALLFLWVLLLAFAGGNFYMPSTVLMVIAAVLAGRKPAPAASSPPPTLT